jgi:protoporphyrinogen oxidase
MTAADRTISSLRESITSGPVETLIHSIIHQAASVLQVVALTGLVEAMKSSALSTKKPANFDEWILRFLGQGIANLFMRPYNFKVWAVPTTHMQAEWLGERVATVDIEKAIHNVVLGKEDAGWGPNAVFRFAPY